MRKHTILLSLAGATVLLLASHTSQAAGTNLLSTNNVTGSSGWFSTGVWKTNNGAGVPVGTAVSAPVPGNTYTLVQGPNPAIGNNLAETRTRNPYTSGTPAVVTFPGDSLTVMTNTEIRFKQIASPATVLTVNFPGVGVNPGLILNGGMLNVGDGIIQPVTGLIQAAPGSQSYLSPGGNDLATLETARGFNFSAKFVGSGTLCVVQGTTNNPVQISSTSNSYSGVWLVKAGRLLGSGIESLGTNSSFVLDPLYILPVPPFDSSSSVAASGPAVLEVNYDLNSAGTLTLINGGRMRLHQNCAFTAVTIEGVPLSAGTHQYAELIANYPNNFDPGGSGAITVQPYGPLPSLGPIITAQPVSLVLYAGRTARFSVTANANGAPPLTYRWRKGGVNLSDTGNISGSSNATLVISNVAAGDAANYDVVVGNGGGSLPSSAASLAIATPSGEAYEAAILAANPVAFYQLNETGDPAPGNTLLQDYQGGFVGTYGTAVANGNPNYNIAGPLAADEFAGFAPGNKAAQMATGNAASRTAVQPWNLNTNTVTLTAWVYPIGSLANFQGVVFCRGANTVAGICYSGYADLSGNILLGYNWNDDYEARNWNSGLATPAGQWSFVALSVSPTNSVLYVMNTNGILSATHDYPHVQQSFGGTTLLGDDSAGANGARVLNGRIDDGAVFNRALSKSELVALYYAASGATNFAPAIAMQPTNQMLFAGQTAVFAVTGGGTEPLSYQWKAGPAFSGTYTNLTDGGNISGANGPLLTVKNVADANAGDYILVLANASGSVTSTPANLSVMPTYAAENITMAGVLQPGGADWDTGMSWSDGNAASVSAAMKPGSTYELMPSGGFNTRMRTPQNPTTAVFPGDVLKVTGNGVWANNPGTNGATSEIRFKQPPNTQPPNQGLVPGTVIFKKLIMNGGQLDAGNEGVIVIGGLIEILTNAPFYSDSGNDRGFRIDAQLAGGPATSIEYHSYNGTTFNSNYVNNLNIAGNSNTFSGKWNIVLGTLLGTGANALGTNDIIIGSQGALETTYDINNTNSSLYLSGRMFLHQNDTFRSVFLNGIPLPVGTYTFAQLNASYPTNFPNAWMPQTGATSYTNGGSGSITVLVTPAPSILVPPAPASKYPTENVQFTVVAQGTPPLAYQWRRGGIPLADSGNLFGSTTTNLTITNIVPGNAGNYDVVVTNSLGSVTSIVAVLTVLPTFPATNFTLDYGGVAVMQPGGSDWNSTNSWSDGQPASISALQYPGSSYTVVTGARLRSPANAASSVFPGDVLTVNGSGVWVNNNDTTIGEVRFKHANPGTAYFKRLVMNGGQLDTGDNGIIAIQGRMDVLANTPIYADSGAGQDRPWQIDAWLTGNGSIEYHAYDASFSGNLNITGTSNTFSGKWNIFQGVLLGSGINSLGTNDIIIGTTAALETLYDLNNPQGSLVLDGQMFLHQNDRFLAVTVGGVAMAPGTHTFAQLNAAYPANFPASWPQQLGSGYSTGSGSITILGNTPPPVTIQTEFSGGSLKLTWSQGTLLEANEVTGPWTTNSAPSPFTVSPTEARKFYRIRVQ